MNSCISTNLKINWYLTGPDSSDLEATSGVNGKDPTVDYGEAYATYDENSHVSIFLRIQLFIYQLQQSHFLWNT